MFPIRLESFNIRSAAILTNSYVAAKILGPIDISTTALAANVDKANQLELECAFTLGSLTSLEIKIEFSYNGTTYVQETNKSVSGGTTTLAVNEYTKTTTGNFHISIPIMSPYIKVSAKGTGTLTSSSLAIVAKLGWR